MNKTKLLFICMMGRDRSAKAVEIVNKTLSERFEAKCAGVSPIADVALTKQAVEWADKVICMEREHRNVLFDRFPEAREKEVVVWDISSDYSFNDPDLERELRERIEGYLYLYFHLYLITD